AVAAVGGRVVRPGGLAVTLQDGLGNREVLEAVAPGRVRTGVCTLGATLLGPAKVRGFPGSIAIGGDPDGSDVLMRWVGLLEQSGFQTDVPPPLHPILPPHP